MVAERERSRAESMLRVCGNLIDLDTATLTVKILKHVSTHVLAGSPSPLPPRQLTSAYMYVYSTHVLAGSPSPLPPRQLTRAGAYM